MAREKITTTALPRLHAAAERYAAARRRRSARYQEPPRENRRQDALWFAISYPGWLSDGARTSP